MNIIPGWPRALGELAGLYREPAEKLFEHRDYRNDPEKFDLALDTAIFHCESARAHIWPEDKYISDRQKYEKTWKSAAASANRLAKILDEGDSSISRAVMASMHLSGIHLRSKEPVTANAALARLLRQIGRTRYKFHGPKYRIRYGPLDLDLDGRLNLPSHSMTLTITLAHVFKCVKTRGKLSEQIEGGNAWDVAAAFANATDLPKRETTKNDDKDPSRELASNSRQWLTRYKGRHLYRHRWGDS